VRGLPWKPEKEFTVRFLMGMGIGYAIGILIAPSAGKVTRTQIKERIDSGAREKAREIGARAGEMAYEELKESI
jgi:gas vesicle protein